MNLDDFSLRLNVATVYSELQKKMNFWMIFLCAQNVTPDLKALYKLGRSLLCGRLLGLKFPDFCISDLAKLWGIQSVCIVHLL